MTQQRSLAAIVYYTGDNLIIVTMCTLFDQKVWRIRHENDSDENHNGENGTDGRNPAPILFEMNQDTCKNQAPSSKTQIENGKIEFFFYHLLFDQNFYRFWSSNKWKLERKKIKINFGVTSHPRRLVAKIPADIMAEKSIPRAPRIEMVVVSPDYYGKKHWNILSLTRPKNPWRNGQSCFSCGWSKSNQLRIILKFIHVPM